MNGYPLMETLLVALLVGGSLLYVGQAAWRGVRAAGSGKGGCSSCKACGSCPTGKD